jgi:protein AATF/BFR2
MAQIDHSLSSSERERLIKRTRVRRGEGKVVGGGKGLVPLEGESTDAAATNEKGKEIDEECFDDNDFYQQLLREVVESRMLDLGKLHCTSGSSSRIMSTNAEPTLRTLQMMQR